MNKIPRSLIGTWVLTVVPIALWPGVALVLALFLGGLGTWAEVNFADTTLLLPLHYYPWVVLCSVVVSFGFAWTNRKRLAFCVAIVPPVLDLLLFVALYAFLLMYPWANLPPYENLIETFPCPNGNTLALQSDDRVVEISTDAKGAPAYAYFGTKSPFVAPGEQRTFSLFPNLSSSDQTKYLDELENCRDSQTGKSILDIFPLTSTP